MSNASDQRPRIHPLLIATIVLSVVTLITIIFTASTVRERIQKTYEINSVLSENRSLQREIDGAVETLSREHGIDPSLIDEEGSSTAYLWCEEMRKSGIPFSVDGISDAMLNRPAVADIICPDVTGLVDSTQAMDVDILRNADIECTSSNFSTTIRGTIRYDSTPALPEGIPADAFDIHFKVAVTRDDVPVSDTKEVVSGLQVGESRAFEVTLDHSGQDADGCNLNLESWWPSNYKR